MFQNKFLFDINDHVQCVQNSLSLVFPSREILESVEVAIGILTIIITSSSKKEVRDLHTCN